MMQENGDKGFNKIEMEQFELSVAMNLVITLLTCGIYNLYWNYMQMEACNTLLGREEFSFLKWIVFSLLTCGLYHIVYQYKMGAAITEIQFKLGLSVNKDLPILSIVATIFGFSIMADCIHQIELKLFYFLSF